MLFLHPTSREVDISVPEQRETLVLIDGDSVKFVPANVGHAKEKLRVREDKQGKGLSMQDDGYGRMDNWFWYQWSPQTGYGAVDMHLKK